MHEMMHCYRDKLSLGSPSKRPRRDVGSTSLSCSFSQPLNGFLQSLALIWPRPPHAAKAPSRFTRL